MGYQHLIPSAAFSLAVLAILTLGMPSISHADRAGRGGQRADRMGGGDQWAGRHFSGNRAGWDNSYRYGDDWGRGNVYYYDNRPYDLGYDSYSVDTYEPYDPDYGNPYYERGSYYQDYDNDYDGGYLPFDGGGFGIDIR